MNFVHSRPVGCIWAIDEPAPEKDYQNPEYLGDEDLRPRFQKNNMTTTALE